MDIACYITMVFISLKVCLILFSRIFNFSPPIVALVPTVIMMKGSNFYPLFIT